MEKFDLEKWKTGDYDVVTRNGKKVRIICTDRNVGEYSIVALIAEDDCLEDKVVTYTCNGRYNGDYADGSDLFLVKKKWQPKWNDVYYYIDDTLDVIFRIYDDSPELSYDIDRVKIGNCFQTKEEAEAMAEKIKELLKQNAE